MVRWVCRGNDRGVSSQAFGGSRELEERKAPRSLFVHRMEWECRVVTAGGIDNWCREFVALDHLDRPGIVSGFERLVCMASWESDLEVCRIAQATSRVSWSSLVHALCV